MDDFLKDVVYSLSAFLDATVERTQSKMLME